MKRPKPRIKKVFLEAMENPGKPLGKIMRENGYADNTADNPQDLTRTKTWEELLDLYLPDWKLAKVANEGLEATTVKTSFTEPDRVVPDMPTRRQYLETALKMKGKITDKKDITSKGEKIETNSILFANFNETDSK